MQSEDTNYRIVTSLVWTNSLKCLQTVHWVEGAARDNKRFRDSEGHLKGGGHVILFLRSRNESTIFLRIFSERFHCQTGTCIIDFSPILFRPARRSLLRSIWGVTRLYVKYIEWLQSARMWRGYPRATLLTSLGELIKCCTAVSPLDIYINDVGLCVFAQDRALGVEARTKEHGKPFRALVHCYECSSDSCLQCDRGLVTRMTRTEVTESKAAKMV